MKTITITITKPLAINILQIIVSNLDTVDKTESNALTSLRDIIRAAIIKSTE